MKLGDHSDDTTLQPCMCLRPGLHNGIAGLGYTCCLLYRSGDVLSKEDLMTHYFKSDQGGVGQACVYLYVADWINVAFLYRNGRMSCSRGWRP